MIARVNRQLASLAGIRVYLQASQDITIGARVSKSAYQFTLVDADPAELAAWAAKARDALTKAPGLTGVASDAVAGAPELNIAINRDAAARLGVTPQQIDDALYDAFGERPATKVYSAFNAYQVILEVAAPFRTTPDALNQVYLRSSTGQPVPLGAVASISNARAPLVVNHDGGFPSVTLSFNLKPNVSIGAAVDAVNKVKRELHLPPTVQTSFQGNAQAFQQALGGQAVLILAALIAVYLILGMLYESWIHPLTILSTLPSAGLGALLALMGVGMPLDVIGIIGIVLLIGIVKKNGIMMVDFALQREREGASPGAGGARRLPGALPADPDDHPVRHARRRAADAGGRRRRGDPPAPRLHHRGRPGRVAGADPVHHPGRLSVHGKAAAPPAPAPSGPAPAPAGRLLIRPPRPPREPEP